MDDQVQLVMMIFLMLLTLRILAHAKDRKRNLSRKLIEENNNEFEQVAKVVEEHMRNREMIDEDKEDFNPNHEGNPVNRMSVEGAYIPYESQLSFFHRERYPRRQYRSCIIPEPNNSEVKSVLIYTETYFRQQVFHTGSRVLTNEEVYRRYQYKLEQISDLGQQQNEPEKVILPSDLEETKKKQKSKKLIKKHKLKRLLDREKAKMKQFLSLLSDQITKSKLKKPRTRKTLSNTRPISKTMLVRKENGQ